VDVVDDEYGFAAARGAGVVNVEGAREVKGVIKNEM
jgi:hypothetical protein